MGSTPPPLPSAVHSVIVSMYTTLHCQTLLSFSPTYPLSNHRHYNTPINFSKKKIQKKMVVHEKEAEILAPLHRSLIEEKVAAAQMRKAVEETLLLIKPDAVKHHAAILMAIDRAGFSIECTSMVFTRHMADSLAANFPLPEVNTEKAATYKTLHAEHLVSGTVLAVVLRRVQAVSCLLTLLGPNSPEEAKKTAPESLRALYGTDDISNAAYSSASKENAYKDVVLVLGYTPQAPQQEAAKEEDWEEDADQTHLSLRELKELARKQLEDLKGEREKLAAREAELRLREQLEVEQRLYPSGVPKLQLAVGTSDIIDCSSRIIRHCTATNPMGIPLTPRSMRSLFDSLDTERKGTLNRTVFKTFYEHHPQLQNHGVPQDLDNLDRRLTAFKEQGMGFDDFCIFLFQAAKR